MYIHTYVHMEGANNVADYDHPRHGGKHMRQMSPH